MTTPLKKLTLYKQLEIMKEQEVIVTVHPEFIILTQGDNKVYLERKYIKNLIGLEVEDANKEK